jgi:Ca-activated chloride channel homolog
MKALLTVLITTLLLTFGISTTFADALIDPFGTYPTQFLELRSIHAEINIHDQVATIIIDQTFENSRDNLIDGKYYFPLPEQAAVTGFGRWINNSIYYFTLEARPPDGPNGGVGSHTPLGQYLGENAFACPLVEIPSGEFTMRLEYAQLVDYDFGLNSLEYPLGMGGFLSENIEDVTIEINIDSQREIESFYCGNYSYDIVSQNSSTVLAIMNSEWSMPTDNFIVEYSVNQEDVGMWLMPHYYETDDISQGYFLAILEPGDLSNNEVIEKTFTFVIDCSGSMSGNKIVEAKEAAIYCIENLQEDDLFNIVRFSSSVQPWHANPVPASQENINSARSHINSIQASGGTNLNGAVLYAIDQEVDENTASQVLLLSDGQPTAGVTYLPTILENIQEHNNNNASIFTIGVGNESSSDLDFLNLISLQNHGLSLHIAPETTDISEAVSRFFDRFSVPVLTDVNFDFLDEDVDEIYPPAPYNIFAGSQTIIAGQFNTASTTEVVVTGNVAGVETTISYGPFNFDESSDDQSFVPRMWAKSKIDYWIAWMAVHGEDQEIIDMIVELSLTFGIMTEYTNYNTPVDEKGILNFEVATVGSGVLLSWSTADMPSNVRFDIYRSDLNNSSFTKLNDGPLTGNSFLDKTAQKGAGYLYKIVANGDDMKTLWSEVVLDGNESDALIVESISPNPFNEQTQIRFAIQTASYVTVEVYDILGRKAAVLCDKEINSGSHIFDLNGSHMSSGVYFLRINAMSQNNQISTSLSRITLLK